MKKGRRKKRGESDTVGGKEERGKEGKRWKYCRDEV